MVRAFEHIKLSCTSMTHIVVLLLLFVTQGFAEQTVEKRRERAASRGEAGVGQSKPASSKAITVKLTRDEEARALKFVQEHHPELAKLLKQLRDKSRPGFDRGAREIHLATQRLERIREKQPARFESELKDWKLGSEIQLLIAKWSISQDPRLEKQIKAMLRQRQQAKIDRQKAERNKVAERLKQLDHLISMGTDELDADLAAEWDRLAKRAASTARARRNRDGRKPATKPKKPASTADKTKPSKPVSN